MTHNEHLTQLAKTLDSLEDYHLERTLDLCWGLKADRAFAVFERGYDSLVSIGATFKDRLVWGDADCGAWVEPHDSLKIVCIEVYCAMRDDNTYLYIAPKEYIGYPMLNFLHGRTCWPRQKLDRYGKDAWGLGDWRSVTEPSIQTYRHFDFAPGYTDFRDKGYAFTLRYTDPENPTVEGSMYHAGQIAASLRELDGIERGLADPLELPRNLKAKV
jgi:hypothetical protein